jgi:ribosomal protein L37AE/L43A
MMMPVVPRCSDRCQEMDVAGIAERVRAATWLCSSCGMVASTVEVHGGYASIRPVRYVCQQKAQREARDAYP